MTGEVIILAISITISIIVALSAYIWKGQNKRIDNLEKKDLIFIKILPDITGIKKDVEWIKKLLEKKV